MKIARSRSLALPSSSEQVWNLAFWASIAACEIMGLLLSRPA
jgi:hypothetical protein